MSKTQAAALRRAAVRLLLSLTASAADLHINILVDLFMPLGFEAPITALLTQAHDGGNGAEKASGPSALEDAALLLVLLAAYRRHESPNAFLRLLSGAAADAP